MGTTRLTRHIRAPRAVVYRALLDADAVKHWMVPDGMTSHVHSFDADAEDGTDLIAVHEDLPPGVSAADNEVGWSMSIEKLARLVEGR
jgi:hypothetical protein